MAAMRASAALLCSPSAPSYSSSSSAALLTSMAGPSLDEVTLVWLAQLLENANNEMLVYAACKCMLPNETYTLALAVWERLLDAQLSSTPTCMSQEVADLCFLALSRVSLQHLNRHLKANKHKHKNSAPPRFVTTSIVKQQQQPTTRLVVTQALTTPATTPTNKSSRPPPAAILSSARLPRLVGSST